MMDEKSSAGFFCFFFIYYTYDNFCVSKIKYRYILYKVQDSLQQRCSYRYMWELACY